MIATAKLAVRNNTRSLISLPLRGFYFQLEKSQRNLDFPLKIGYNDHFKYHSQYLTVIYFYVYKRFSLKAQ